MFGTHLAVNILFLASFGVDKTRGVRQNSLVTAARMPNHRWQKRSGHSARMATSWPRTPAQWRREQLGGCVPPLVAQRCTWRMRGAFRSQATRRYVQSVIPFLARPMARSCGLGRGQMQTPCTDFLLCAGGDRHPCRRRGGLSFFWVFLPLPQWMSNVMRLSTKKPEARERFGRIRKSRH